MPRMTKTVTETHEVPVDRRIEDLVLFVEFLDHIAGEQLSGVPDRQTLIRYAEQFWEREHGED